MKEILNKVFLELDTRISEENKNRRRDGGRTVSHAVIKIIGQASLLAQPELTISLTLAQTGDLDAFLDCDYFIKSTLKEILPQYGLIYDEDSPLVFVPKGSQFAIFSEYKNLTVKIIDPESALVSKAVKAPEKNKLLIREAIASGEYSGLIDRIELEGGDLKNFI